MQEKQLERKPRSFSTLPTTAATPSRRVSKLSYLLVLAMMNSVSVVAVSNLSKQTRGKNPFKSRRSAPWHRLEEHAHAHPCSTLAFVSHRGVTSNTIGTIGVQQSYQPSHTSHPSTSFKIRPLSLSTITRAPANDTVADVPSTISLSHKDPASPDAYAIPRSNWGTDDLLTDLRPNQRIVSFGDVHGDLHALLSFLTAAQVLHPDSTANNPIWNGGDTILVQCGDILDRGADELSCLRILTSLARQAPGDGGRVFLLHGNHEALNANGLFQYADPDGNVEIESTLGHSFDEQKSEGTARWRIQYAGNEPTRWAAFEPGGWLSQPLYSQMPVAVVVGKTCFVHAGLTKDHLVEYGGVDGMNAQVKEWFESSKPEFLENDDGFKFETVQDVIDNAQLRARTFAKSQPGCLGGGIGASSPVWMRDYSSPGDTSPKSPSASSMMNNCLKEFGKRDIDVQRMVMGHTPQRKINAALDGRAWRVDVGASSGVMNGTPEVLEILHQGGENGEDLIHILTVDGKRIPAMKRQTLDLPF